MVETRQQRRLSNEAAKGALPLQRASVLGVRSSSCANISAGSRGNQPRNKADFVPDIYRVCGAGSDHAGDGPNAQSSVDSVSDSAELFIGRKQPSDSPSQEEKLSGTALIGARVKVWWGGATPNGSREWWTATTQYVTATTSAMPTAIRGGTSSTRRARCTSSRSGASSSGHALPRRAPHLLPTYPRRACPGSALRQHPFGRRRRPRLTRLKRTHWRCPTPRLKRPSPAPGSAGDGSCP